MVKNILLVTQVRIRSTRFPSKILKKIGDQTLLEIHLNRLKKSNLSSKVMVATTKEIGSDQIIEIANKLNVKYFRGSTNDVLDRIYKASILFKPNYLVRVTSDCPLIDPKLIDCIIEYTIKYKLDYCSNTLLELYPDGQDIEVIKFEALKKTWKDSEVELDREHVTPFIRRNTDYNGGNLFLAKNFSSTDNYGGIRMTVDEESDFLCIKNLVKKLGINESWKTYANYIIDNPKEFNNQSIKRNYGYFKEKN